jgi:hypothetical protein
MLAGPQIGEFDSFMGGSKDAPVDISTVKEIGEVGTTAPDPRVATLRSV